MSLPPLPPLPASSSLSLQISCFLQFHILANKPHSRMGSLFRQKVLEREEQYNAKHRVAISKFREDHSFSKKLRKRGMELLIYSRAQGILEQELLQREITERFGEGFLSFSLIQKDAETVDAIVFTIRWTEIFLQRIQKTARIKVERYRDVLNEYFSRQGIIRPHEDIPFLQNSYSLITNCLTPRSSPKLVEAALSREIINTLTTEKEQILARLKSELKEDVRESVADPKYKEALRSLSDDDQCIVFEAVLFELYEMFDRGAPKTPDNSLKSLQEAITNKAETLLNSARKALFYAQMKQIKGRLLESASEEWDSTLSGKKVDMLFACMKNCMDDAKKQKWMTKDLKGALSTVQQDTSLKISDVKKVLDSGVGFRQIEKLLGNSIAFDEEQGELFDWKRDKIVENIEKKQKLFELFSYLLFLRLSKAATPQAVTLPAATPQAATQQAATQQAATQQAATQQAATQQAAMQQVVRGAKKVEHPRDVRRRRRRSIRILSSKQKKEDLSRELQALSLEEGQRSSQVPRVGGQEVALVLQDSMKILQSIQEVMNTYLGLQELHRERSDSCDSSGTRTTDTEEERSSPSGSQVFEERTVSPRPTGDTPCAVEHVGNPRDRILSATSAKVLRTGKEGSSTHSQPLSGVRRRRSLSGVHRDKIFPITSGGVPLVQNPKRRSKHQQPSKKKGDGED